MRRVRPLDTTTTVATPATPNEPLRGAYDVPGACAYLSISRAELYRLMERGELIGWRYGRLRRFSRTELDRWIAAQEESGGGGHAA